MSTPLLVAEGVCRSYRRGGPFRARVEVTPLVGVDLALHSGAVEGLAGPSGTGKSTLARVLTFLERPDAGRVALDGDDPWNADGEGSSSRRELARARRACQLLPQEPGRAVSPRWDVLRVVTEPFEGFMTEGLSNGLPRSERRERAAELLARAELDVPLGRRARDLSGGQLQRLVLARALACEPRLLVLDETLTGLDLSLRARLCERLLRLRDETGLALVLVSHDVDLLRHVCDRVWRLDQGRLLPWTP